MSCYLCGMETANLYPCGIKREGMAPVVAYVCKGCLKELQEEKQ